MSGVGMSAIRAQGGREREAMRPYEPLAPDHPSVGEECAVCGAELGAGDVVTIIPLGPGSDAYDQARVRAGRWYSCIGVIGHAACAGLALEFGDVNDG